MDNHQQRKLCTDSYAGLTTHSFFIYFSNFLYPIWLLECGSVISYYDDIQLKCYNVSLKNWAKTYFLSKRRSQLLVVVILMAFWRCRTKNGQSSAEETLHRLLCWLDYSLILYFSNFLYPIWLLECGSVISFHDDIRLKCSNVL